MSTSLVSSFSSRTAEGVSTKVMPSSGMPRSAAMILAISTSKPSGSPVSPLSPNSGWSNLVPTVIAPSWLTVVIVVRSFAPSIDSSLGIFTILTNSPLEKL